MPYRQDSASCAERRTAISGGVRQPMPAASWHALLTRSRPKPHGSRTGEPSEIRHGSTCEPHSVTLNNLAATMNAGSPAIGRKLWAS